jgi:hypothetical protein
MFSHRDIVQLDVVLQSLLPCEHVYVFPPFSLHLAAGAVMSSTASLWEGARSDEIFIYFILYNY